MFTSILSWLGQSISFCYSIFLDFMYSLPSFLALFCSMFLIFTVVRMIILPIIGSAMKAGASDYVKKERSKGGK